MSDRNSQVNIDARKISWVKYEVTFYLHKDNLGRKKKQNKEQDLLLGEICIENSDPDMRTVPWKEVSPGDIPDIPPIHLNAYIVYTHAHTHMHTYAHTCTHHKKLAKTMSPYICQRQTGITMYKYEQIHQTCQTFDENQ